MLPLPDMEECIRNIKQGDSLAREDFLENSRPFVFRVACKISGRILEWGRDDELAVGLIAFNEAIDRFREDSGVPFLAYARLVIGSRLSDYFRRENRKTAGTTLITGEGLSEAEHAKAWEVYWEEAAAREREEEIGEFQKLLKTYGVSFEDLVKCSPKHSDTRRTLMLAAHKLAYCNTLMEDLKSKKKLPLLGLEKSTGVGRKTLERGRKYIIAIALLIYKREEFVYLGSYLKLSAPIEGGN